MGRKCDYPHIISLASRSKVKSSYDKIGVYHFMRICSTLFSKKQRMIRSCLVSDRNQMTAIFILKSKNSPYKCDVTLFIGYHT